MSITRRLLIWIAMSLCWFLQAISVRHTLNPDGISYLEMAYSLLQGHWRSIFNGYWSPGYPLALAAWLKLFDPQPRNEIFTVRLFGWLTSIVALATFEWFLKTLMMFRKEALGSSAYSPILSDDDCYTLSYSLFFLLTTLFIPAYLDHPDTMVFIIYLAAITIGMKIIIRNRASAGIYLSFGAVLGTGYIIKAVMLPLAIVFLMTMCCYKNCRNVKLFLSVAAFLVVSLPLIVGLSISKGRFTFGDSGTIARAQRLGLFQFGRSSPGTPTPASPHIQIYLGKQWSGSYPGWSDPSAGFNGNLPRISLRLQLNRIHIVLRRYLELLVVTFGSVSCAFLILIFLQDDFDVFIRGVGRNFILWVPAIAGLAAYSLISVEDRFLPGFIVAFFAAFITGLVANPSNISAKVTKNIVVAASAILIFQAILEVGHTVSTNFSSPFPDWEVASSLQHFGVEPGDRVSYIGEALIDHTWAHLARVQIASEIPKEDVEEFWAATTEQKKIAFKELAEAGSKVVLTRDVPAAGLYEGWTRIAKSRYYVLQLP